MFICFISTVTNLCRLPSIIRQTQIFESWWAVKALPLQKKRIDLTELEEGAAGVEHVEMNEGGGAIDMDGVGGGGGEEVRGGS